MANEAVIIELLGNGGDPIRFTVADGATIEKGTLLKISDPRTAAATSADGDLFVGIAAAEKVADDGATTIAAYTNGIFDIKDGNAGITVGNMCKINGANTIAPLDTDTGELQQAECVGMALETAAANEVIAVRVLK
jgi:hypothetical protein